MDNLQQNQQQILSIAQQQKLGKNPITLGKYQLFMCQDEERDYNYYSKAWHRSYGPKVTISNRRVELRLATPNSKPIAAYGLDAWRGNYILKALEAFAKEGFIKMPRKGWMKNLPKSVQISDLFWIDPKFKSGVAERKLRIGNDYVVYDYVAFDKETGLTFHDAELVAASDGLEEKIENMKLLEKGGKVFTYELLRRAGFCEPGIQDVAESLSLNVEKSYTQRELIETMLKRPKVSAKLVLKYPKEFQVMKLGQYIRKAPDLLKKLKSFVGFDLAVLG